MTANSVSRAIAPGCLFHILISPEPLGLLVPDAFLHRSLLWEEVDISLALSELEYSTEPRSRPCSETKEVSPAASFQCLRVFNKEAIVLWVADVDDVAGLSLHRAEREFVRHPFAICVKHPGYLIDQTVGLLTNELVEPDINGPGGCDIVELDKLLVFLDVEVAVDEADAEDFLDLVLLENRTKDVVDEFLAISCLEFIACGGDMNSLVKGIARV